MHARDGVGVVDRGVTQCEVHCGEDRSFQLIEAGADAFHRAAGTNGLRGPGGDDELHRACESVEVQIRKLCGLDMVAQLFAQRGCIDGCGNAVCMHGLAGG